MFQNPTRTKWALLSFWRSAFLYFFAVTAMANMASAQTWQFGNQRLIRNGELPVTNLQVAPGGRAALRTFRFVGRVGGIALEAVATFPVGSNISSMMLKYDPAQSDGMRAALHVDGQIYRIPLYDWQLRPIANFANSPYTAIVSLFGEGPDRENNYYIEFHAAFINTLLGLRLLQADIMFIDLDNLSELPRDEKGIQVIGPGEKVPDISVSNKARSIVDEIIDRHHPQSWVLTDVDQSPKIRLVDGIVNVDLNTYYYFWRAELVTTADKFRYARLQARLRAAREAGNSTRDIEEEIARLKAELQGREPAVIAMEDLTSELEKEKSVVTDINPAVSNAVSNTAKYAAFFRAYKAQNADGWRAFLATLPSSIKPDIKTPNQWSR
jgi:hypothetical protein